MGRISSLLSKATSYFEKMLLSKYINLYYQNQLLFIIYLIQSATVNKSV